MWLCDILVKKMSPRSQSSSFESFHFSWPFQDELNHIFVHWWPFKVKSSTVKFRFRDHFSELVFKRCKGSKFLSLVNISPTQPTTTSAAAQTQEFGSHFYSDRLIEFDFAIGGKRLIRKAINQEQMNMTAILILEAKCFWSSPKFSQQNLNCMDGNVPRLYQA